MYLLRYGINTRLGPKGWSILGDSQLCFEMKVKDNGPVSIPNHLSFISISLLYHMYSALIKGYFTINRIKVGLYRAIMPLPEPILLDYRAWS